MSQSLASILTGSPERAHALAPYDGRITARLSQTFVTASSTAADFAEATRLAHLALRQDPTAVRAVITLGLNAQVRGDVAGARRLYAYADTLSRRESQTQLWAIEDAVARNDIPGALRQYDIALRTSRTAPDLLFPVLAAAVDDPAIRAALAQTLASDPVWGPSLTLYISAHSDPAAAVNLFRSLPRAGGKVTDEPRARLINRLISNGSFAEAWNYYSDIASKADRRMSRDPRFEADLAIPTPFDWVLVDSDGISSLIQPGERGGVFDFSAPASVGGPALQQMQMLPPGDYRLEGHSDGIDQPEGSRPYWMLSCHDGRELGRVVMPNSVQAKGAFSGRFTVPAGCLAQMLTLIIRPSDSVSGVAGSINQIRLLPAHRPVR
ncbi:lipopolysaccharide assembly protein LapB [Sphingomonas sp. LaA6.9]|uniref:tetratricopeptide repeat protein n=1 Tax=Sphingomonas sp. LaA6.9 TaxID=2919914 RepID=UPI001F4F79A2|nr:hypothetical protein [Sphingomonas sp. LaA6.9]MCJ8158851.1 hypothetical protein [Sphingomonas sp. LaA6.9]